MPDKAFPTGRSVLLSDVARDTCWLEIGCRQCGRYGRLSVLRLIREHGATATAWSIVEAVSAACPQRAAGVHWTKACRPGRLTLVRYMEPLPAYEPTQWKDGSDRCVLWRPAPVDAVQAEVMPR